MSIRCADGMCGAEDCPTCRPFNFRGGVFIGDMEDTKEPAQMNIVELYDALEAHDWKSGLSEKIEVYEAGQKEWIRLFFEARKVEGGEQMFRDFTKHALSGPEFGTPKHSKPGRPVEVTS